MSTRHLADAQLAKPVLPRADAFHFRRNGKACGQSNPGQPVMHAEDGYDDNFRDLIWRWLLLPQWEATTEHVNKQISQYVVVCHSVLQEDLKRNPPARLASLRASFASFKDEGGTSSAKTDRTYTWRRRGHRCLDWCTWTHFARAAAKSSHYGAKPEPRMEPCCHVLPAAGARGSTYTRKRMRTHSSDCWGTSAWWASSLLVRKRRHVCSFLFGQQTSHGWPVLHHLQW